jgi:hypothetical protein
MNLFSSDPSLFLLPFFNSKKFYGVFWVTPENSSVCYNGVYINKVNHPQTPQRHHGCDGSHYKTWRT